MRVRKNQLRQFFDFANLRFPSPEGVKYRDVDLKAFESLRVLTSQKFEMLGLEWKSISQNHARRRVLEIVLFHDFIRSALTEIITLVEGGASFGVTVPAVATVNFRILEDSVEIDEGWNRLSMACNRFIALLQGVEATRIRQCPVVRCGRFLGITSTTAGSEKSAAKLIAEKLTG
jgi:hypothetical protein